MDDFQRLQQATCAVIGLSAEGSDIVLGTAWLARSPGTLMTAAHVVENIAGKIRVQFPGSPVERASIKAGPVYDQPRGVDVAVLELDQPSRPDRTPLPMLLVNNPHGDVVVCGYGTNLPDAQSFGYGEVLRPYIRDNTPTSFLLQYRSRELTFEGFSGGAVFSLSARAVVGLQTEASEQSEQVLAMPLSRIPEYWQELLTVAEYGRRGLCVVLVPRDSDALLLEGVIKPALLDLQLEAYVSATGASSAQDLAKLDQANIVVADVTMDDSFVTRELTIAHGLGTPDIIVRSRPTSGNESADPAYPNVLVLDATEPLAAKVLLKQRTLESLALYDAVGELVAENPITSFFGAPLTQVSAANALALGYFINFVAPVGHTLCRAPTSSDVVIKVEDQPISVQTFESLELWIVLPRVLNWSMDSGSKLRRALNASKVQVASVYAPGLSRERRLSVLRGWEHDKRLVLLDIFPTTMASLIDSINERFRSENDWGGERWRAIERKEIDRFSRGVVRRIRADVYDATELQLSEICTVLSYSEAFPEIE